MKKGWMFFVIGIVMDVMKGGYVSNMNENKIKNKEVMGIIIVVNYFI
jgi:hypothetical protein